MNGTRWNCFRTSLKKPMKSRLLWRNADLTSKTEKCSAALRAIRQEVSEHGFCADWDEIVFQCDQALEYRKNTEDTK